MFKRHQSLSVRSSIISTEDNKKKKKKQKNKKNKKNEFYNFLKFKNCNLQSVDMWIIIFQYLPTFEIIKCREISLFFYLLIGPFNINCPEVDYDIDFYFYYIMNNYNNNIKNNFISSRIKKYLKCFYSEQDLFIYRSLLFNKIYFGINTYGNSNYNWIDNFTINYFNFIYNEEYEYYLNLEQKTSEINRDIYLKEIYFCKFFIQYGEYINSIEINGCSFITDRVIKLIFKYCPNLEQLILNNCTRISFYLFDYFLQLRNHLLFDKLKVIKILNCKCTNNYGVYENYAKFFSIFKNLKELSFDSYCKFEAKNFLSKFIEEIIFNSFKLKKGLQFKQLMCPSIIRKEDGTLEESNSFLDELEKEKRYFEMYHSINNLEIILLQYLQGEIYPNLTSLEINSFIINDLSLNDILFITYLLPNLIYLKTFVNCETNYFIEQFTNNFKKLILNKNHLLKHLDLQMSYLNSPSNGEDDLNIIHFMKSFPYLETFNLRTGDSLRNRINDLELLNSFIKRHIYLKRFRLSFKFGTVDNFNSLFENLQIYCKDLKCLHLENIFIENLIDDIINELYDYQNLFKNLTELVIDLCSSCKFTKYILQHVNKYCNENLKILKLINIKFNTNCNLNLFTNNLKELTIFNCEIIKTKKEENFNNTINSHNNTTQNKFTINNINRLQIIGCNNTSFLLKRKLPIIDMNELKEIRIENCERVSIKYLNQLVTNHNIYKIEKIIFDKLFLKTKQNIKDRKDINFFFNHFYNLCSNIERISLFVLKCCNINTSIDPTIISKIINKSPQLSFLHLTINCNWSTIHKELLHCKFLKICKIEGEKLEGNYCKEFLDNFQSKGFELIELPYLVNKNSLHIYEKRYSIMERYRLLYNEWEISECRLEVSQ
ncbi:hypothetical protein ABK040_013918 [Willaertia magna]